MLQTPLPWLPNAQIILPISNQPTTYQSLVPRKEANPIPLLLQFSAASSKQRICSVVEPFSEISRCHTVKYDDFSPLPPLLLTALLCKALEVLLHLFLTLLQISPTNYNVQIVPTHSFTEGRLGHLRDAAGSRPRRRRGVTLLTGGRASATCDAQATASWRTPAHQAAECPPIDFVSCRSRHGGVDFGRRGLARRRRWVRGRHQ